MANEFIARNGLIAQDSSTITGSLTVTQGITGSLFGTASWANNAQLVNISDNTSYGGITFYPVFSATNSGTTALNVDSQTLTYNPETNILTTTSSRAISSSHALTASSVATLNQNVTIQRAGGANLTIQSDFANSASITLTSNTTGNPTGESVINSTLSNGDFVIKVANSEKLRINPNGTFNVTGSLKVSEAITGSLFGTASQSISSSYALTASYLLNGGAAFPYTGDAQITGSLQVLGSATFTGPISASDYQTSWSDFSSASTLVGWSSTTRKVVRYMRIGKLGIVEYDIFGTSNSATVATFTIPFTASGLQVTQSNNNQCFNTATVPSGQTAVASGSSLAVVNYYSTAIAFGSSWSGNKGVRGVLTLEID